MKKRLFFTCMLLCLTFGVGTGVASIRVQEAAIEAVVENPSQAGFELYVKNDRLLIKSVDEQSDAYQKGMRKGYRMIGVQKMGSDRMDEIRELLCADKGAVEVMFVDHVGEVRTVTVSWPAAKE